MDTLFGSRFYGDNLDSIVGSDSSEESLERLEREWPRKIMSVDGSCSAEVNQLPCQPQSAEELCLGNQIPYSPISVDQPSNSLIRNQDSHAGQIVHQTIEFPLGIMFPNDHELKDIFPQADARAFAALARDLQVVTNFHVNRIQSLGGHCTHIPDAPTAKRARPSYSIAVGLCDVINHVSTIRGFMMNTLEMYKGDVFDKGELGVHPGIDEAPWVRWPYNKKRVFLTKLLSKYMGMKQPLRMQYTEISDYSLSAGDSFNLREPLFEDGQSILLNRSMMITLEDGLIVSPNIVTAWARVLNNRATRGNRVRCPTKIRLSLVDQGGSLIHGSDIVEQWMSWLRTCEINIRSAKVVFIPFTMLNHYALLVVNFLNKTVECFDTIYHSEPEQECWDLLSNQIRTFFCTFMEAIGENRASEVLGFNHMLINPCWSTTVADIDSGVSVMHLMDCYNGTELSLEGVHLEQEHVRVRVRIEYASEIVLSTLNVYRHKVLERIPRFIEDKLSEVLCPSAEVLRCRNIYTWGGSF